jgi:hypothetical protein
MDLDILFPFHRVDKFLAEAIESVNLSNSVNFNLIAIDDRPNQDKDISYLFKSVKNSKILHTSGGLGYGLSLKLGSEVVEAPYTALFNSDDLIDPLRFRKQLSALENSDLSITSLKRINEKGRKSISYSGSITSSRYDPLFLLFGSYGANASWCMHSEWWKKNAFFDSQECLDWRIAMTSFRATNISYLNEPLYFYRKHRSQITANKKIDSSLMDPVYSKWEEFASSSNIKNSSRNIFDLLATPWLFANQAKFSEIDIWVSQIEVLSSELDGDVRENLLKFIHLRYFWASLNRQNKLLDRFYFSAHSFPGLSSLVREAIF